MNKPISRLLCAIALAVSTLGSAQAAVVAATGSTVKYDDSEFSPVSQAGNSFTFDFAGKATYKPDGDWREAHDIYGLLFTALPGYTLTGKMSVQVDASYTLNGQANAGVYMSSHINTIVPVPGCVGCGLYDGDVVSFSTGYASSISGPSGTLTVSSGSTPALGAYNSLFMYLADDYFLFNSYGTIQLNSITFTAEAVPLSAVPELPPIAMLAAGLALIGAGVCRKRTKSFDAAASV